MVEDPHIDHHFFEDVRLRYLFDNSARFLKIFKADSKRAVGRANNATNTQIQGKNDMTLRHIYARERILEATRIGR